MQTDSMHLFQLIGFCSLFSSVADVLILKPTDQPTKWLKEFQIQLRLPTWATNAYKAKKQLGILTRQSLPPTSAPIFFIFPSTCQHFFLTHFSFLFFFFCHLAHGSRRHFSVPSDTLLYAASVDQGSRT